MRSPSPPPCPSSATRAAPPRPAFTAHARTAGYQGERGSSLIEIAVALAVLALLAVLAAPSYAGWLADLKVAGTAHQLAQSLALARSEAIKHGGRVNLCKSGGGRRCADASGWEAGWIVFTDEDASGVLERDETIVRVEPAAPDGVTARANHPLARYVSFTPLGHARLVTGALQMGTFTVCRSGRLAYQVVLAHSGRVRVERTKDPCP